MVKPMMLPWEGMTASCCWVGTPQTSEQNRPCRVGDDTRWIEDDSAGKVGQVLST